MGCTKTGHSPGAEAARQNDFILQSDVRHVCLSGFSGLKALLSEYGCARWVYLILEKYAIKLPHISLTPEPETPTSASTRGDCANGS